MEIHPGNAEQVDLWDGDRGAYWLAHVDRFDEGVSRYQEVLLAAVQPGDRVLDIGCGPGTTTLDAARRGASALGVDISARMIEAATEREKPDTVSFLRADAQVHPFPPGEFDVAISRNGAQFFADPVTAFGNIGRALRDGGRLALLVWQTLDHNEFLTAVRRALAAGRDLPTPPTTAPSPFALSDPDRVRTILGEAGFTDIELEAVSRPMSFGPDVDDAFDFISGHWGGIAADLDPDAKARAFDALRTDVEEHLTDDGVLYGSAAWLITARR